MVRGLKMVGEQPWALLSAGCWGAWHQLRGEMITYLLAQGLGIMVPMEESHGTTGCCGTQLRIMALQPMTMSSTS